MSGETRSLAARVPSDQVVGSRNSTVHASFAVDWDIVWTTAVDDAPAIADAVREIIEGLRAEDDRGFWDQLAQDLL